MKVYAFLDCNIFETVYYCSTEEQWALIDIGFGNFDYSTKLYYYSKTNPFEGEGAVLEGNYWHYDVDGNSPVIWTKETL